VSILVVDVGTSGVRAAIVRPDATVEHVHYREVLPSSPAPGFVEFDARAMADAALETAAAALAEGGPVDAVGIANQRASTIVWDANTSAPIAAGVGWQDLRTAGMCLVLAAEGTRFAPNQSATKLAFLLDMADPARTHDDLRFGTVDTWIAWVLSNGTVDVTDQSNVGVTGLVRIDGSGWDEHVLEVLRIPPSVLPAIVDSTGIVGNATALDGAPPIAGIAGDQQASLIGQGCVRPGLAKATFGTGGMLDMCLGSDRPAFDRRGEGGTFPIAAWRREGQITWGVEAIMLTAGTNVEWLRDDLGLISAAAESHDVAAQCDDTEGVIYVPALLGLGTPRWDYGARSAFFGLTRGSTRPQLVRAVLEGIAQRGADLVEAAETDTGLTVDHLRVDGGMTANPTFLTALANATQRPVEVSPVLEATTVGAAFLAGLAVGTWEGMDDIAATWRPRTVIEPTGELDRARWLEARSRAEGWVAELSSLDF
jgi:glycerol kinase